MTRHLIHIGYPKTGSTYLKRWFKAHPEIGYADLGIAGLSRANELIVEAVEGRPPVKWRATSCEALTQPGKKPNGEPPSARPASVIQQTQICETLASLFPNATILLISRGFRSIMLSSYSQYVRAGGCAEVEELLASFQGEPVWDYSFLTNLYKGHFGAENVITLPYELLRDDPDAFLKELAGRLGIEMIPFNPGKVNPSLSPVELRWYPRIARAILALPVGARLRRSLFSRYAAAALHRKFGPLVRLLQTLRPARPVTADLIPQQLVDSFAPNAKCFRDDPLYRKFAADYLL